MSAGTLALAAALGALGAMGAVTWAHATPSALPCGFECQWPMGSHSEIPATVEVGVPFQVSVWYAWEEVPSNPAIGTAAERTAPGGYYGWPVDLGPATPPEGYAGSSVVLRLPEEFELLGYEPDLERRLLWIDGNGRSTYEYTGTLPYRPGSGAQSLLLNVVLNSPVVYEDTELHVDLGLSLRDAAPPVWVANNAGAGRAALSTEPRLPDPSSLTARTFAEELREIKENPAPAPGPAAYAAAARAAGGAGAGAAGAGGAGAAGAGAPIVPALRHTYVYPPPVVTPLPESAMPEEARRPGAGGASAADQVIVLGQLIVRDRDDKETPAADAVVCLYDMADSMNPVIIRHTGVDACRFLGSMGQFAITVPYAAPGEGVTTPSLVARVFTSNNFASVRMLQGNSILGAFSYDLPLVGDYAAGFHDFRRHVLETTHPLNAAYAPLAEITEAHEFIESEFGYDVPRVTAYIRPGGGALYSPSASQIALGDAPHTSSRHTVLHEYGHHVHSSVYGQDRLPYGEHCNPHVFNVPSSEQCAWVEGWANFVPSLVDGSPVVKRTTTTTWDLESGQVTIGGRPQPFGHGDAVEGRVSALLWDLHDSPRERGDGVSGGTQLIWDALRGSTPASSDLPATTVHEFREDWEARGYPSLGEAFALNTIPSIPPQPASLTVHAEAGGAPKSGAGARHASAEQDIVVTLGHAGAAAPPTVSFYGAAASPMERVGGGGSLWRSAHTVTQSTPEGSAVFRVSAGGTEYTPASITSGGNVVVDTTAPAASAEFTGQRSVVLEFSEPPLPESVTSSAFAVTPASGTAPSVTALHVPGSPRVVLNLGAAVAKGMHMITVPSTLEDMAGNEYAGGSLMVESTHVSAAAPAFSVDAGSIRSLTLGTEIVVEFSQGVTGSTDAAEWKVVPYSAGGSPLTEQVVSHIAAPGSEPSTSLTRMDEFTQLALQTAQPMPPAASALYVRYAPASGSTSGIAGEAPLAASGSPSFSASVGFRDRPAVEGAEFVDARTVRLSLDGPLGHSGGPLPFVDAERDVAPGSTSVRGTLGFRGAVTAGLSPTLGDTVVEYGQGSREVTLHSSDAASASADHHVVIPPSARLGLGPLDLRLAQIQGAGYSGALQPDGGLVATNMDTAGPEILTAYAHSGSRTFSIVFTKPLDPGSLEGGTFTVTTADPQADIFDSHRYEPGSLRLDLTYRSALGSGGELTATVHGGVRGENGEAVSGDTSVSATPSASTGLGIASASFDSPRELTVTLSRPIDPAFSGHVTVSGLGSVVSEYEARSLEVTLRTENAAAGGETYDVRLLNGIRDHSGTSYGGDTHRATYTATADTAPPEITMVRTVAGSPDSIRVHFDEELSTPLPQGFAVGRVGDPASIASTPSYVEPDMGGPRVDLGLGDYSLLEGARYTVTVPAVSDGTNMSMEETVTVAHTRAPVALSAEFTGPNSIRLSVSEPLDASTLGGITVVGLGETTAGPARDPAAVILRTTGTPVDGMEYEVRIPPSVADADGTRFSDDGAGGSLRTTSVTATYGDTTPPGILRAELRAPTTTAVVFDEDVAFADRTRSGPHAAHWTVSAEPGGSLDVSAVGFPAATEFNRALTGQVRIPHDSGRTLLLTHEPAPPRSEVRVSYSAGADAGAVTDTASPPNELAAVTDVAAADATPPSFTARTASDTSTLVEFTRTLGGFTAASAWNVDGMGAASISIAGGATSPGAARVFVPQGTASVTLGHQARGPGDMPLVAYAPQGGAALSAGAEDLGGLSTLAADGIAPAVMSAEFVDRQTIVLTFTEPLDASTVAAGAFSVTAGGVNLLAATNAVTHHEASPVVVLRLSADAAPSAHTVTVPTSVTDANGAAYAAPATPVTATPQQRGAAGPFTAETASISQTVVTFNPAVEGATSASEWEVDGSPATGIVVSSPGASSVSESVTLPGGTTSLTLSHRSLGSTGATPVVSYSPPGTAPLKATGGDELGAHTEIAADGASPTSRQGDTVTTSETTTDVTFGEPVRFRGAGDADRAGKWSVAEGMNTLAVSSVVIKPDTRDTTITITHAPSSGPAATPRVMYTATGDGSLEDGAGNSASYDPRSATDGVAPSAFAMFEPVMQNIPLEIHVWLDEGVSLPPVTQYRLPFSIDTSRPEYIDLPGLALASENGSDVPVYLKSVMSDKAMFPLNTVAQGMLGREPESRLVMFTYVTPVAGAPYTLTVPPAFEDEADNARGYELEITHGTDMDGPVLERAAFTGSRTLYAEFDEPLMASSVLRDHFTVTAPDSENNLLDSVTTYVEHSRRVTLNLANVATEGITYSVAATDRLQDARGNVHAPADPAMATYDTTPPTASVARFVDRYTLEVDVSEPLDVDTVRSIRATGVDFGIFDIEYEEGTRVVTLSTLSLGTEGDVEYPEARVTIPASVTDANDVAFEPTTLFTSHGDTMPPDPHTALTVSPTSTLVRFDPANDRIRLDASSTPTMRAVHWLVTETHGTADTSDDTNLAVTDVAVAEDWRSLLLTHAASSGAGAQLSVSYVAGNDDDGRVRDWAEPANVLAANDAIEMYADAFRPGAMSLTLSLVHDDRTADPALPRFANADDKITATLTLDEPAGENAPTIDVLGEVSGMMASPTGQSLSWTHEATVTAEGAAQGELAFEVRAWDAEGNAATLGPADLPAGETRITIDTVAPGFEARHVGAGVTVITFGEPVSGLLVAADWTVDGAPATGASALPDGDPSPVLALSGATSAALHHTPLVDTSSVPAVAYSDLSNG